MMSQNPDNLESGGISDQANDNWWLSKWAGWLATVGAVMLAVFGFLGIAFNAITFSIFSTIASGLQLCSAGVILAIEGSSLVAFLTYAKPIKLFFDGKPAGVKALVYFGLSVVPLVIGWPSIAVLLGFIVSMGITAIYGMILIGRKGSINDMRAAAEQPKI